MDFTPQINLLKGFCTLNFGVSSVDAELVFGKPEEIQVLDDPILETSCTVYHYWESGFSSLSTSTLPNFMAFLLSKNKENPDSQQ